MGGPWGGPGGSLEFPGWSLGFLGLPRGPLGLLMGVPRAALCRDLMVKPEWFNNPWDPIKMLKVTGTPAAGLSYGGVGSPFIS